MQLNIYHNVEKPDPRDKRYLEVANIINEIKKEHEKLINNSPYSAIDNVSFWHLETKPNSK